MDPFPSSQASQASQASHEIFESSTDIMEDLMFQRAILASIADTVDKRADAENEVKEDIQRLERKYREAKQREKQAQQARSSSHAGPSSHQHTNNQRPSFTAMSDEPFAHSNPAASPSSTRAMANSAGSTALPSGSQVEVRSRKRGLSEQHDAILNGFGQSKSRRTTPNAFAHSETASASSFDDFGPDEDNEMIRMMQEIEARKKREQEDAELARRLQNESSPPRPQPTHRASSSQGFNADHPSTLDLMMGRGPSGSNPLASSQSGRSAVPSYGSQHPMLPPGTGSRNVNVQATEAARPIKTEQTLHKENQSIPGSYPVDDDSDELQEITAYQFANQTGSNPARKNRSLPWTQSNQNNGRLPGISNLPGLPAPSMRDTIAAPRPQPINSNPYQNGARMGNFNNPFADNAPAIMGPGTIRSAGPSGSGGTPVYQNGFSTTMGQISDYRGFDPRGVPSASNHHGNNGYGAGYGAPNMPGAPGLAAIIQRNGGRFGNGGISDPLVADLHDFVSDPRNTEAEIQNLLDNIRPDMEVPKQNREGTPEGLRATLYEHQKLALAWMKSMEDSTNNGGILADDMGLGKTVSTISLLLTRKSTDRTRKTTLIVGPVSLLRQWQQEIKLKIKPGHQLTTYLYHGGRKSTWDELRNYDIVLTTYGTISAEFTRLQKWLAAVKADPRLPQRTPSSKRQFPFLGETSKWYRVVLDEAQCIKNKNTKSAQGCAMLQSKFRFCLTGTPMMNGVHELYSLIHFLKIRPYSEWDRFNGTFGCLTKSGRNNGNPEKAMQKLQVLLKAILLRRTKKSEIDGQPIISLPDKIEVSEHVVFTADEKQYYEALEHDTRLEFNKYVKAGTVGKNYANALVLLLRLRQAACHPHLIMDYAEAPNEGVSAEGQSELARSLPAEVVVRLLAAESFDCPICYEPVPNPRFIIPCGHNTCSECLVKIVENANQQNIAQGDEQGSAKCPECRGPIDMKKIIDLTVFNKVHGPDADLEDSASDDDDDDDDEIESGSETESGDDPPDISDLKGFVVADDHVDGDTEDEDADEKVVKSEEDSGDIKVEEKGLAQIGEQSDDDVAPRQTRREKRAKKSGPKGKKGKGKGKASEKIAHTSLADLKKQAMKNVAAKQKYMDYLRDNWVTSAKVDKTLELLREIQRKGEKTIVFSQFTTLLDLLQVPIEREGWGFERYDGSMSGESRAAAANAFLTQASKTIMLVSLKAGNAGLNLVAASQVIIMDPFWNPYVEMQAVDRAHRIGQRRVVQVHRLLVQETVEDRIIELQNKKKELVEAALDEKQGATLSRLGERELRFLFGSN